MGLTVGVDPIFIFLCFTVAGAFFSNAVLQTASGLVVLLWLVRLLSGHRHAFGRSDSPWTGVSWPPRNWPLWKPSLAFLLVSILSAAASADSGRSFSKLHEAFLPLLLFAALPSLASESRTSALIRLMSLCAFVAAGMGLYEFTGTVGDQRIQGSLGNWMTYSQVLLLAAPMIAARLLWCRSKASPIELIVLLVILAAILCSKTRGVWLGGIAGAALLLLVWRPKWVLALPFVILAAYALAPQSVQDRAHSLFDKDNATIQERLYMWRAGCLMVEDRPLLGIGPGQVKALYPQYRLEDDPRTSKKVLGHLHSNPVQIAAELGLIGVSVWIWFWIAVAMGLWHRWREQASGVGRASIVGVSASLLALQVAGLTEYNFGDSEVTTLAFCILAMSFVSETKDSSRVAVQSELGHVAG
ncbi:MAG: O-antigen ligase [Planctomycetota bacterium]